MAAVRSRKSREALVAAAKGAEVAIGFEDGPGDPSSPSPRGAARLDWQLRVTGTPAHSSQIFREEFGPGAIFEAARILNAFREKMAGEEHLTFNPGVILGGTAVDFDPAQVRGTAFGQDQRHRRAAVVAGDLRTLSPAQLDKARRRRCRRSSAASRRRRRTATHHVRRRLSAAGADRRQRAAARDLRSREPRSRVRPGRRRQPGQGRRRRRVVHRRRGEDDSRRRRPDGHDDHTPGETADLSTLPSQTKRAAITLYRLSQR